MAGPWDQFAAAPEPAPAVNAVAADLPHGEDYLKAHVPTELQPVVKQIVEGRSPYPAGFLMKTPLGQQLTMHASQYDPDFDAGSYPARAAQRKNYEGGGKQYQELQAIGTVAGHLKDLKSAAEKLNNWEGLSVLNAPMNIATEKYRQLTQDPRLAEFNTAKSAVSRELTKAYQGGHVTDSSIAEWQQNLNASQTPEQLRTVIGKLNDLLMSKRITMEEGYKQTMGKTALPKDFSSVNDRTRKIFDELSQWSHGDPVQSISQSAAPAQAQPNAPTGGVAEGMTATNPQTGAKIQFRGGQWVPAQ